jgi:glycosyltransferase involved in cell wall biosynthesis
MIKALEKAQDQIKKRIDLVLVSNIHSATLEVLKVLKESTLNIITKENITDDSLGELYERAKGLINPSLYEGFGLPVIEAMQASTPVIISNIKVFLEITNGNAYFFDPNNQDELADLIIKIEKNEFPVDQFTSIAKKNSEKFSWSSMAAETLALYKRLVATK